VYADGPTLDNGPLWFVEVLLIYSLVYAAWVGWRSRGGRSDRLTNGPLRVRQLVALGVGIAISTFVIRRWFPFDSLQFTNAHVWQWPECIGLFGLGIVSAAASQPGLNVLPCKDAGRRGARAALPEGQGFESPWVHD
jgi:hypothetical protein